jgi:penicillin G amidase
MRRQNTNNHTHAGASAHLAWGFTNIEGDFLELVTVEVNPENAYEYKTPEGWTRFEVRPETVRVRGAEDVRVEVKTTVWVRWVGSL